MGFTKRKTRRIVVYVSEETYREWKEFVRENRCERDQERCLKKLLGLYRERKRVGLAI